MAGVEETASRPGARGQGFWGAGVRASATDLSGGEGAGWALACAVESTAAFVKGKALADRTTGCETSCLSVRTGETPAQEGSKQTDRQTPAPSSARSPEALLRVSPQDPGRWGHLCVDSAGSHTEGKEGVASRAGSQRVTPRTFSRREVARPSSRWVQQGTLGLPAVGTSVVGVTNTSASDCWGPERGRSYSTLPV